LVMMQQKLKTQDFSEFQKESERLTKQMEQVLQYDLPQLMKLIQPHKSISSENPFDEEPWVIPQDVKVAYDEKFQSLNPNYGKLSGQNAREFLVQSGLDLTDLRKIWELADFEKDGNLDSEEFALVCYMIEMTQSGQEIPEVLPLGWVPISKRKLVKKKRQGE